MDLQREQDINKKISYSTIEKWIILDSDINNSLLIDQVTILKNQSNIYPSYTCNIPETIKFIIETPNLDNLAPSVINRTLLIFQQDLDFKHVLETKLNEICLKYNVPQSKNSILQEYSVRYFNDLLPKMSLLSYKSMLHKQILLNKLNFINFIYSYSNFFDCLMKKFEVQLKQADEDDVSNWKALKSLSAYAFFWSVASYLTKEEDLAHFNEVASEIITNNKCEIDPPDLKLCESNVDILANSLTQFKRAENEKNSKNSITPFYEYQEYLIKLCIENSKPCLIYGDVGVGKTSLIEKMVSNKYDFVKMHNLEPNTFIYDNIIRQNRFYQNKKYISMNGHKYNNLYFIDDLNLSYQCPSQKNLQGKSLTNSSNMELMRQLLETQMIYSNEEKGFISIMNNINFLFTSTNPETSDNYLPLSQRLTKHLISIHLSSDPVLMTEAIFASPILNWLEEFPQNLMKHPREMAQAILKSLCDVYISLKSNLRPVPKYPQYLFNFKDIAKVVQGMQLLASKTKLVAKAVKKNKETQQDVSVNQVATVVKLFCHEVMRVFADRIIDPTDENLLRTILLTAVVNNFCSSNEADYERLNEQIMGSVRREDEATGDSVSSIPAFESSLKTENTTSQPCSNETQTSSNFSSDMSRYKKTVTFKAGLTDERNYANYTPYRGALINREQLGIYKEEAFLNSVFSKNIIKASSKKDKSNGRNNYSEASLNDLMNSATASLDNYEREKNLRMNFFFHDKALQHLARLTRILSINGGHALLVSEHFGLGRTSLVRFCAFLCRMKYYESRVTNDEAQSEAYLKSVLRQCCLMSGVKGSFTVVYVKAEFHSHRILENLATFVKTGVYPNLFSEKEIWCIANETTPTITSAKRVERTLFAYNNFTQLIRERVRVVLSLESGLSSFRLANLLSEHSFLFTEFYVDIYKKFSTETLNSIAHYYLALQIEENKMRKLNKFNPIESDTKEVSLNGREVQIFSSSMASLHQIACDHYMQIFAKLRNSNRIYLPRPFSVTMFKQVALFFHIYMKRLRDQELIRIEKFQSVFKKLDQVSHRLENYEQIREELLEKLKNLTSLMQASEEKIASQKEKCRRSTSDCHTEEKLLDDMAKALEQIKSDVNKDSHELKNMYTPQFEIALKALKSMSLQSFVELRSFRQPPQRVLAVINTLCLMFRQPPGWENGKQLLIRENFFDDLIYYDKRNIPQDIFDALEQICQVETFTPEYVKVGSLAASALCEWILSVYRFARYERKISGRSDEMRDYQDLYNKRMSVLGQKRVTAEKMLKVLEEYCQDRLTTLKDTKRAQSELENLEKNRENVKHLVQLIENDQKNWQEQYNKSMTLIKSYKPDALLTACYVCYAGVFDSLTRNSMFAQWVSSVNKLSNRQSNIKFDAAETEIIYAAEVDEKVQHVKETTTPHQSYSSIGKFTLRSDFNIKEILLNIANESKELIIQLNRLSLKDEFFIINALILRELCTAPTKFNSWLLIYDPENITLGLISALQESIDQSKMNLNSEYLNLTPQYSYVLLKDSSNSKNNNETTKQATIRQISRLNALKRLSLSNPNRFSMSSINDLFSSPNNNESSMDANMDDRVESLPPLSSANFSQLVSNGGGGGNYSRVGSSVWEASTFYSRAQTTMTTVYHTRSGNKLFLKSLQLDNESQIHLPNIETDLNIMPKNNLCVLDSSDPELDYKLINAAVHGLAVVLKNSERYKHESNKLIEILLEKDFQADVAMNKEFIKIGDEEILIDPAFKIIMHVNTPMCCNYGKKNNHLFGRLNSQMNAAHFVIDFTLSSNYIKNDCLLTIMEKEKPGYRNQLLLSDKIAIETEFNLINRQVKFFFFR